MDYEKIIKNALNDKSVPFEVQAWLEEQFSELKESEDERIRKELLEIFKENKGPIYISLTPQKKSFLISLLEKQGGQNDSDVKDYNSIDHHFAKPIDKIEPNFNFKVGQWIVATGKCVYFITKIDGFNVTLVDVDGNEYVFDTSSLEDAHLLTIDDVQNGCKLGAKWQGKHDVSEDWSEEDEEHIHSLLDRLEGMCKKGSTFITTRFAVSQDMDWLKSLKGRVQPQPKQEWGKEDIRNIENIDSVLFYDKDLPEDTCVRLRNWLKYLRPQPKQWWGEEDERIYQSIIDDTVQENQLDSKQIDWLKSIKSRVQPKQEWSEEEKGNVDIIVSRLEVDIEYWKSRSKRRIDEDKRVIDWLKSLRPQNTWKPSEKQMLALKDAEGIVGSLTIIGEQLKSLYQDLKKL